MAVASSTDVLWTSGSGPKAGDGNIAQDIAPEVQAWQRYPARVTLTLDDAGMTAGAETYYEDTVLPIADAAGAAVGVAITVGYPLAQTLVSEFQDWVDAGRDVTSHSMSHTYYTNTEARNTARQDTEIEATKARVVRLEQIAATNTEARIRTEVQLGELRDGQIEIKALIQAHDNASKRGPSRR